MALALRPWLHDTGSTWHSTNDPRVFKQGSMRIPETVYEVEYGNKVKERAAGIGTVEIPTVDTQGKQTVLVLHDVLFLPRSGGNIFSPQYYIGSPGNRTGNGYYGGQMGCFIKPKQGIAIRCTEHHGCAYIAPAGTYDPKLAEEIIGTTAAAAAQKGRSYSKVKYDKSDIRYWHVLLGHASVKKLMQMQNRKMVDGMPAKFINTGKLDFCRVCWAAKMKRVSVKSGVRTSAVRKFQYVSTDLMELNVRSIVGHFKWAVVYCDHWSRSKYVYGIQHKSDAYKTLELFLNRVVYPSKSTIETIQCDGGGEFQGWRYRGVMSANGISMNCSPAFTAASNGLAERSVGMIANMTRALLKQANKPKSWWLWAAKTSCYLLNRLPTTGLSDMITPHELMTGKKPDLSHLRPWGSDMMMYIYDHQRRKLDDRARHASFVLYPEEYSARTYTGYDAKAHDTPTSMHVAFDRRTKPVMGQDGITGNNNNDQSNLMWRYHTFRKVKDNDAPRETPSSDEEPGVNDMSPERRKPPLKHDEDSELHSSDDSESSENSGSSDDSKGSSSDNAASPPILRSRKPITYFPPIRRRSSKSTTAKEASDTKDEYQTVSEVRALKAMGGVTHEGAHKFRSADDLQSDAQADADIHGITESEAMARINGFTKSAKSIAHGNCCRSCGGVQSEKMYDKMVTDKTHRTDLKHQVYDQMTGIMYAAFNSLDIRIPANRKEAMSGFDSRHWKEAERVEMEGMHVNGVFTLVPETEVPRGANICQSRYVYDIKTDEKGRLSRYKVRWVAKGFSQRYGKDYFETFSPVVRMSSINTLMNLAVRENWSMQHVDIKTCFLEADLPDSVTIYVRPPEGYGKPGMVAKLHKSLYGLKQSSREWAKCLSDFMVNTLSYTRLTSDSCIFKKLNTNKQSKFYGQTTYVGAYVDDLLITGGDVEGIKDVKAQLKKRFRVSDLQECKWLLGCELQRDFNKHTAVLSQTKFINDILNKFKLQDIPIASTPAISGDKMLKEWIPTEGSAEDQEMTRAKGGALSKASIYRGIVGSLLWLSRCTRPDISYQVSQLSRHLHRPGLQHLARAIRVCAYIKGTKEVGIKIGGKKDEIAHRHAHRPHQLYAFSDSSFCDQEDSKSSYGYLVCMNGSPVTWAAKTQIDQALSTCEAEYIALSHATSESMYLTMLLEELGYKQQSIPILVDNQAAIAISKDPKHHSRTRHIRMRYHHTRHEVATGNVSIEHLKGTELPADLMTKGLTLAPHEKLRRTVCSN